MQGLSIVVATADATRFAAALEIAAANSALDHPTRIFLQAQAVPLLGRSLKAAAEIASLTEMMAEALALGVKISACQSGLSLAGMTATDLDDGIETEGVVSFLAARGEDQLLIV